MKFDFVFLLVFTLYPTNNTCSKLLIKHQNDVIDVFLGFLLLTYFIPFSSVSFVKFEQVNVSWVVKIVSLNYILKVDDWVNILG